MPPLVMRISGSGMPCFFITLSAESSRRPVAMPKATLSRILSALRRAGYLALDPGGKGYVLGPEFMNLIPAGQPHRARLGEKEAAARRQAAPKADEV